jgi:hypothetical protein
MKTAPDFAMPILFLLGVTRTSLAFAQDITRKALEQARVELRRAVQEGRVAGTAYRVLRDGLIFRLSDFAGSQLRQITKA